MILVWIMLVVGFVLLIKGADYFVEGSSAVAKILRIPSVVIGLTIVAMGTSAPELAVSVTAALTGNNEIAVGNVIGSNIFNLMVVTGMCGVILPMAVDKGILNGDFIFSILISGVLLAMFAFDMKIGRLDGVILLVLFAYFIIKLVRKALKERTDAQEEQERLSTFRIFLYVVGGIAAIVFGGDIVVDCASKIASSFGLSQNLIGLTIVAMGTSLPELVTSIVASRKGENGLALGNVIGSNIFNILMILGISSAIHPIAVTIHSAYDLIVLIVFSTAVWLMARTKKEVNRGEGIAMLALYAGYMVYIILR
ncbi:MAG: calcium/sodium antiporter [Lachnospiraceae bacterium]|jgi:cation:H+ antiporter